MPFAFDVIRNSIQDIPESVKFPCHNLPGKVVDSKKYLFYVWRFTSNCSILNMFMQITKGERHEFTRD